LVLVPEAAMLHQAQAALAPANSSVAPDRHINFRIGAGAGVSVGTNSRPAATADAPRIVITDTVAMPLLPDKPSIAVLPFQNMSGDPEQEYFADGLVEDIITALSRFRSLFE
jgi:hypothetical protein